MCLGSRHSLASIWISHPTTKKVQEDQLSILYFAERTTLRLLTKKKGTEEERSIIEQLRANTYPKPLFQGVVKKKQRRECGIRKQEKGRKLTAIA